MGYECPVCSDPQADAGHLANHLAFTALLGDDGHEAWLDEHAPEWGSMGETELADVVGERVEETEFPRLFEDTAGGLEHGASDPPEQRSGALFDDGTGHAGQTHGGAHDHDSHGRSGHDHGDTPPGGPGPVDEETAEVLAEARKMTRRMRGDDEDDAER